MSLREQLVTAGDRVEALFFTATEERDAATGEKKTKLRKISKNVDKALALLETAEDMAKSL